MATRTTTPKSSTEDTPDRADPPQEDTQAQTDKTDPPELAREPFETVYALVIHGGIVVTGSPFATPVEANEHGVATYGNFCWWAILPILAARLPKEDDNG